MKHLRVAALIGLFLACIVVPLAFGAPPLAPGNLTFGPPAAPANLTATAANGAITVTWQGTGPNAVWYRLNAWESAGGSQCACEPPPGGVCVWSVLTGPTTCGPAIAWLPSPADVWTQATSNTYTGLGTGVTWSFWAQACFSQSDPASCSPMSLIAAQSL